jgi:hypothetical protein
MNSPIPAGIVVGVVLLLAVLLVGGVVGYRKGWCASPHTVAQADQVANTAQPARGPLAPLPALVMNEAFAPPPAGNPNQKAVQLVANVLYEASGATYAVVAANNESDNVYNVAAHGNRRGEDASAAANIYNTASHHDAGGKDGNGVAQARNNMYDTGQGGAWVAPDYQYSSIYNVADHGNQAGAGAGAANIYNTADHANDYEVFDDGTGC